MSSDRRKVTRVGMIGSGFMARMHSAAYGLLPACFGPEAPRVELVRIAGSSPERAETAARELGWKEWARTWEEVALADDIDVVDIVVPNTAHRNMSLAALKAGKRVICEKPLATSYADALEMAQAVPDVPGAAGVCFSYRTWPLVETARRMIDDGDIGEIYSYRGYMLHDHSLNPDAPWSWRLSKQVAGAGAIGDIGSHCFDLARYLCGDIAAVMAETRTVIPERLDPKGTAHPVDVDDEAAILLRFASGARGTIEVSWMAAGTKMDLGFEVRGSKGALNFAWSRNNELRYYDHRDPEDRQGFRTLVLSGGMSSVDGFYKRSYPVPGMTIGYQDSFIVILNRFLRSDREALGMPTFADGAVANGCVEAALQSAASGRWTPTPRLPQNLH